jgi:radical SAM superfamily enzyme YgiQ (UPF0313 family)
MVSFGVESGSQTVLNNIAKGAHVDDVYNAVSAAKRAGLAHRLTLSVGNPGESGRTIGETVALIKKVKPNQIGLFLTKLYPGTVLYERSMKLGLIDDTWWFDPSKTSVPFYTAENRLETLLGFRETIENAVSKHTVDDLDHNVSDRELS